MEADHPTASELYEIIHESYPNISRATVFRVLAQFAENGEILKLSLSESSARFDARLTPHAHAHCLICGRVFDVYGKELDGILNMRRFGDFDIVASNLEFIAVCKDCKAKKH